ncbi:hypothetical protein AB0I60_27420 [Actinosynnema sp. NPDC050436]|uniref:hypothetical protein n=1 Tax=Actinosynnema sp. NPDC050436 TaxID=3155659 RepID=UPI0033C915E9
MMNPITHMNARDVTDPRHLVELAVLTGHTARDYVAVLRGSTLATAGEDRTIRL